MYNILLCIKQKNLKPAIDWCKKHSLPNLEFQLHKLQFIQLLQNGVKDAIEYARNTFPHFNNHLDEIKYLMGSLLYSNKLKDSPYKDLLSTTLWDDVIQAFTRECCLKNGCSVDSPLYVCVTAGSRALPTLLKVISVTQGKSQLEEKVKENDQLSVEVDLGDEFQFHSIFSCPVSKEQATAENPPMILPCGHVLCKESILKLVNFRTSAR